MNSETMQKIDMICKTYDKTNYPGIAVGVIENGKLVFCKGYGIANLDYDVPIDGDTVFHVCSMAKQLTATCIALLIEEGRLSLNQDIRTILPQLPDFDSPITLSNLIYMTNGLPDVYNIAPLCGKKEDDRININEFWRYLNSCHSTYFTPGDKWSYGNTGYFILGQIVEAISHVSLSQYADEHIFKPLGMHHTFIRDDRTKIIKNRAMGYSSYHHVHYNDIRKPYISRDDLLSINEENVEVGGAGQLWTTINDFFLWDQNFYNNILGKGSQDLIGLMTTSGLLNNNKECGYGFGLFIGDFHGHKIVHHGGSAGGYSAYYAQLPQKHLSVIMFGNHTDFFDDFEVGYNGIIDHILEIMIGYDEKPEIIPKKENEHEPEDNQIDDLGLTGRYMEPSSSIIWNISKKNEDYFVVDSFGKRKELHHFHDDVFTSTNNKESYHIIRDNNHKVVSIEFKDGKKDRFFLPFIKESMDYSLLIQYQGKYVCEKLGVTYVVTAVNNSLFISNENLFDSGLDLYYVPAIKDTFISDRNKYDIKYCVTFYRNQNNDIISFSYRDCEQTLMEKFSFVKSM